MLKGSSNKNESILCPACDSALVVIHQSIKKCEPCNQLYCIEQSELMKNIIIKNTKVVVFLAIISIVLIIIIFYVFHRGEDRKNILQATLICLGVIGLYLNTKPYLGLDTKLLNKIRKINSSELYIELQKLIKIDKKNLIAFLTLIIISTIAMGYFFLKAAIIPILFLPIIYIPLKRIKKIKELEKEFNKEDINV